MCGIFCSLGVTHHVLPSDDMQTRLNSRGPDITGTVQCIYPKDENKDDRLKLETRVVFYSTVLSLRGSKAVGQPLQDTDGNFTLCWNGEAWSVGGHTTSGNDTEIIHGLLSNALMELEVPQEPMESANAIAKTLSQVAGPYAFVFYDSQRGRIFMGRDFLGRRSLMRRIPDAGDVIISSVSDGRATDGWVEIEADGVHWIDLRARASAAAMIDSHVQKLGRFSSGIAPYQFSANAVADHSSYPSVIPRLSLNKEVPSGREPLIEKSPAVAELHRLLQNALSLRILGIPDPPSVDTNMAASNKSKLGILFSGGLDCTTLARISHDLLPPSDSIDLLNVAFENPRIHKNHDRSPNLDSSPYELCPDRITGRASYTELQRICPGRNWRFVAIDVPYSETMYHRDLVISLMYPHNTEMDLSIANALYFAARGRGSIKDAPNGKLMSYQTPARVLLSGLGADELFAGYQRHATAFKRCGFAGLLTELELDVGRLGKRNLGRDDRVMSHWGKETRFPFLDEKLLSWAMSASVVEKCGFGESEAGNDVGVLEPEKKVLRRLAWKLGMRSVAAEKKRAIQFGARSAKMEAGKTKGTELLS